MLIITWTNWLRFSKVHVVNEDNVLKVTVYKFRKRGFTLNSRLRTTMHHDTLLGPNQLTHRFLVDQDKANVKKWTTTQNDLCEFVHFHPTSIGDISVYKYQQSCLMSLRLVISKC